MVKPPSSNSSASQASKKLATKRVSKKRKVSSPSTTPQEDKKAPIPLTKRMLDHIKASYYLGHDPDLDKGYVVAKEGKANAEFIDSEPFKRAIQYQALMWDEMLRRDQWKEVAEQLQVLSCYEGQTQRTYMRVAECDNGDVEIDLGDSEFHRVRLVKATGQWHLLKRDGRAIMRRSAKLQALPLPAQKGNWKALLRFLNMPSMQQLLLVAYLTYLMVYARHPNVTFPVLLIYGSQGTGKTFLCKSILRGLFDPSVSGVQRFPNSAQDIAISAQNTYLLIYDNLRQLTKHLSDTLAGAATSTGVSGRELFTNDGESALRLHVPVALNGIEGVVVQSDLLSRTLTIRLLPLDEKRQSERQLEAELAAAAPQILAGLYDIAAQGLAIRNQVTPTNPQRLYDFSHWLAVMENVLEIDGLQEAYADNHREVQEEALFESPLAYALLQFACLQEDAIWQGSASDLLTQLNDSVDPQVTRHRDWPTTPEALALRIPKVQGLLKTQKIHVDKAQRGKTRAWEVYRLPGCVWSCEEEENASDSVD